MKIVRDRIEDICLDFLLRVGMEEDNFHRPVTQGKPLNPTVCANAVNPSQNV